MGDNEDNIVMVCGESAHGTSELTHHCLEDAGHNVIMLDELDSPEAVEEAKRAIIVGSRMPNIADIILHAYEPHELHAIDTRIYEAPVIGKNRKKGKRPNSWDTNRRGKR